MDISSEFGLQVALIVFVPGYFSWSCFRYMAGFRGPVNSIGSLCYTLVFGFGLLLTWNRIEGDSGAISQILQEPLSAAIIFTLIGVFSGFLLGWIVGKFTRIFR